MADRIVITGSNGFLGRHTVPILKNKYGEENMISLSGKDYNLTNPAEFQAMFKEVAPDVLVHLAGYSGGIGANKAFPADFYYINSLLTTYAFEFAAKNKIKKLIYPMGGCSYPSTATSPIDEAQMWQGFPQKESAGYSSAKKMGIVASMSYRTQYNLDSAVIIPGNMYGEYDNFRSNESHVVPGMIRRYYETMMEGKPEIYMWGSGKPVRDFVYAGDVAKTIPYFIEHSTSSEPTNISSGTTTSIFDLATIIKEEMGYAGKIDWDTSKPDGQMIKIFAVEKLKGLGLSCDTSMRDGLQKTIAWFKENYPDQTDGIRL